MVAPYIIDYWLPVSNISIICEIYNQHISVSKPDAKKLIAVT